MSLDASKNAKRTRGRPFEEGNPGGPGRPNGSRNKATIVLEKMLEEDGEAVVQAVVEAAKNGDMTAARLVLDRVCPPRKERPVSLALPVIDTVSDAPRVMAALLQAVAAGDLTPTEGRSIAGMIEAHRRTVELVDIEQRVTRLERGQGGSSI
jgi:hypothetical protein